VFKGKTASEPGIIYCPYRKPSIFRRFIKWIKGKFKKPISVELYVMTVGEPSKYTGSTYPKYLVEREITNRPGGLPFFAHFGRCRKLMNLRGFEENYPIFENSMETAVGFVDHFRFDGNRLMARMTFIKNENGEHAADMIRAMGPSTFRLAPAGCGNKSEDGTVQDDYHLEAFDLTRK
jgi:hypothetical protein